MDKKVLYGVIAAVAILVIAVFYFLLRDDSSAPYGGEDYMSSETDPTLSPQGENGFMVVNEDPRQILERYKKWAQYPPTSRPLHAGMVDLTDPYNADRPPVGVISAPAKGCTQTEDGIPRCDKPAEFSEVQCKMTPQANVSFGKKDFKITLECFDKEGRKDIESIAPKVYRILHRKTYPALPPISFNDNGVDGDDKAGDKLYTFVVRMSDADWGDMFLEANMTVLGLKHNQRTTWYSTPHVVAEFRSPVQDSIKNGHLSVIVPVMILKKGYYNFDANLQEKGGDQRFVATASVEDDFEPGLQNIEFQFWGKILRDQKIDGPYIVREIRGRRNNSPVTPSMVRKALEENREITGEHTEPLWEYIESAPNFETRQYSSEDFSQEEWSSDEKQLRIKQIEEQISSEG